LFLGRATTKNYRKIWSQGKAEMYRHQVPTGKTDTRTGKTETKRAAS
jgi:hypothetical protein